jgi:hypothetical protein
VAKKYPKNHRKPYSDAELALIVAMPHTKASAALLAPALGRTYGSMLMNYRWLRATDKEVAAKANKSHNDNSHIRRLRAADRRNGRV